MAAIAGPVRLSLYAGPTQPRPLDGDLTARLRSVRVTETDTERSVFTLSFDAGRGPSAEDDFPSLRDGPLTCGSRVSVVVSFGATATVLADGFVAETDFGLPARSGGPATLEVTAEDASLLLDLEDRDVAYPNLGDYDQVVTILDRYAEHGITGRISRPGVTDQVSADQRVPSQHGTDLQHLAKLAERNGFACYLVPGPDPGQSTCVWGQPIRTGPAQPAMSVDLGAETNVEGAISFRTSATTPATVRGAVQDPGSGSSSPVNALTTQREPLAAMPLSALRTALPRVRRQRVSGPDATVAGGRAQATLDRLVEGVTCTGVLDGARYGAVLRPRGLVGVRGAGWAHDGLWYVRQVVHDLSVGSYRQSFTIEREGFGSTVQAVPV